MILPAIILLSKEKSTFQSEIFDIKIHAFIKTLIFFVPLVPTNGIFVFSLTNDFMDLNNVYVK